MTALSSGPVNRVKARKRPASAPGHAIARIP